MSSGKPGSRRSKPKTKTFTGCWTCRRRKVKCDGAHPHCARCRRAGTACGGYDLELYWVTDADTVAPAAIKRRAMAIQGSRSWALHVDELDRQLAEFEALEGDDSVLSPAKDHPFGVFRVRDAPAEDLGDNSDEASTMECCSETASLTPQYTESDLASQSGSPIAESEAGTEPPEMQALSLTLPTNCAPRRLGLNVRFTPDSDIHRLLDYYVTKVAVLLAPLDHPKNPYASIHFPKALFGAMEQRSQMEHPIDVVASSNVAVFYSILTVASFHMAGSDRATRQHFDVLARRFRAEAFASVQLVLRSLSDQSWDWSNLSHTRIAHYEAVLSALLCLVTNDVVEGSMCEYWVHLEAIAHISRHLQTAGLRSAEMDRLLSIASCLCILAKSTSVDVTPLPWPGELVDAATLLDGQRYRHMAGLEYAYGINAALLSIMDRIITYSQHISYYLAQDFAIIPPEFIQACEELSATLSDWTANSEAESEQLRRWSTLFTSLSTSDLDDDDDDDDDNELEGGGADSGSDPTQRLLAQYHMLAFAHGLRVYYHTRILPCSPAQMQVHVQHVAWYLLQIEDFRQQQQPPQPPTTPKPQRQPQPTISGGASITWPGFIASCEAQPGPARDVWHRWWTRMLTYRIGNIACQWDVVRAAWRARDAGDAESPAWMPVLRRSGQRVLAV